MPIRTVRSSYVLRWNYEGHKGWGYSFPCSEDGVVDESKLTDVGRQSLAACRSGSADGRKLVFHGVDAVESYGLACDCGSGEWPERIYDGHGIFLTYACSSCRAEKLRGYRPDIMERYEADEPIEAEGVLMKRVTLGTVTVKFNLFVHDLPEIVTAEDLAASLAGSLNSASDGRAVVFAEASEDLLTLLCQREIQSVTLNACHKERPPESVQVGPSSWVSSAVLDVEKLKGAYVLVQLNDQEVAVELADSSEGGAAG